MVCLSLISKIQTRIYLREMFCFAEYGNEYIKDRNKWNIDEKFSYTCVYIQVTEGQSEFAVSKSNFQEWNRVLKMKNF